VAMKFRGAYNASKFALEGLSDTLRLELFDTSIKVILIEPGPIDSQFRANSLKAFRREIDLGKSRFAGVYAKMLERLEHEGPAVPFTLGPEAVTRQLILALESKRPKIRYRVTVPTHIFAMLRRLLPARWMDAMVRRF
jgi:NAD(P)-dependent dehydrogenase (short-subunit alcohol dehydrogenase family)